MFNRVLILCLLLLVSAVFAAEDKRYVDVHGGYYGEFFSHRGLQIGTERLLVYMS